MLRADFTTIDTRQLHTALASTYTTKDSVVGLMQAAGIPPAQYPDRSTVWLSWQALLTDLDGSLELRGLLTAVLAGTGPGGVPNAIVPTVTSFLARNPGEETLARADEHDAIALLATILRRHIGEEAPIVARGLVEKLARPDLTGDELYDATRVAIEYQLLTAKELTPTSIVGLAYGPAGQVPDLDKLLETAIATRTLRSTVIDVDADHFFSRALEREEDWGAYFAAVDGRGGTPAGSTLCRVRATGFVAPQYLVAGLLPLFEDDWRPIIRAYGRQAQERTPFASFQASLWNTWLMWGPSIPACSCHDWAGVTALQYGFGDENNSIPVIGGVFGTPASLDGAAGLFGGGGAAISRDMTGWLRWGPWILRDVPGASDASGTHHPVVAARAQRQIYDDNLARSIVLQVDTHADGKRTGAYFSAYLWMMFLVARIGPDGAPQRLPDDQRVAPDLWRELLPIYVHANIADARALDIQRRALVENATNTLRMLWQQRDAMFHGFPPDELRFYLVGASDYSGCGSRLPFAPGASLVELMRARLRDDPLAAAIVLPPDATSPAHAELASHYATCRLPDRVEEYYQYVDGVMTE